MKTLNEKLKVMLVFLMGTIAGSILSTLFTTSKGITSRKQVEKRTPDLEEDLRKKMEDDAHITRTRAKQMERYTHKKVQNTKSGVKQKAGTLKHKMAAQEN